MSALTADVRSVYTCAAITYGVFTPLVPYTTRSTNTYSGGTGAAWVWQQAGWYMNNPGTYYVRSKLWGWVGPYPVGNSNELASTTSSPLAVP